MRRCAGMVAVALLIAVGSVGGSRSSHSLSSAAAQDTPSTGAPAPDIIPRPDSGAAPEDAGDRGGALQLAVLAAVVLGVGGAAAHLVRQARRSSAPEP